MSEPHGSSERLVLLAALYSLGMALAVLNFYYYVLLPIWIALAYVAVRSARSPSQLTMAKVLGATVFVWTTEIVTAHLYLLTLGFVYLVYLGVAILSVVLAPFILHSIERSASFRRPEVRSFVRLGLVAGVVTPVFYVGRLIYRALADPRSTPTLGPLYAPDVLQWLAFAASVVSGVAFFFAARKLQLSLSA